MTITAEQVARAMDAAYDCNAQGVNAALGAEWYKDPRIPSDVLAGWRETGYTSLYRALTRWHAELVAAETPRKAPDDTDPERLRERREALGLSRRGMAVIVQRHETGDVHWEPEDIRICEIPANPPHRASGRATYAAALSAAEAERAAKPAIDPLAYTDSPAWDEPPVRKPAPEVVDVPQPEPWHARLVRLAQEAQDASRACADAEAAFTKADAERETARKARAAAREVCHVKRQALTEATTAASIIRDAQQGGAS